jgi:hypothetical protein
MRRITFFSIQLRLPGRAPITLHDAAEHDEVFLGPHVSFAGMAFIELESPAHQYADDCTTILQKCY